ncbi:hypothetical protein M422DRAFT_248611 [Sphaerobolus stellatus SS14]|nr:hypothetical protein M422DRAFT_248611 [Sphaerobolus stellatus SS14]
MKSFLLSSLILLPGILATPVDNSTPAAKSPIAGAAYFMTNQLDGNFVISSTIGPDGKLTVTSASATGGNGSTVFAGGSDPLSSQGSVTVSGNNLYVVNAGSNTLSAFEIDAKNPTNLRQIGKPVDTKGEFPISVAVSKKTGLVCVLNGGKINGVNCYKQQGSKGLVPVPNTLRLTNLTVTTPPSPGADTAFGQIIFNEAETQLIVSVQRAPTFRGFLAVWDINSGTGALSTNFREFGVDGAIFPFGMVNIPGQNAVLATDPAAGYEIFDLSGGNRSTVFPIPGQGATCWAVRSKKTGSVFLLDSATGIVTEVTVTNTLGSSIIKQYPLGGNSQVIDAAIASVLGKEYLYVSSPGVSAIDVLVNPGPGNATVIQHLELPAPLENIGVTADPIQFQGMDVYVIGA